MSKQQDIPQSDKPSLRERIALGECVSPLTTEHCPVCVDCCEAAHWKRHLNDDLKELNIKGSDNQQTPKP